jgi:hypothetical protein
VVTTTHSGPPCNFIHITKVSLLPISQVSHNSPPVPWLFYPPPFSPYFAPKLPSLYLTIIIYLNIPITSFSVHHSAPELHSFQSCTPSSHFRFYYTNMAVLATGPPPLVFTSYPPLHDPSLFFSHACSPLYSHFCFVNHHFDVNCCVLHVYRYLLFSND